MRRPHLHLCMCALGAAQCEVSCRAPAAVLEPVVHSVPEFQALVLSDCIVRREDRPICGSCQCEPNVEQGFGVKWRWRWVYDLTFILGDARRAGAQA